MRKAPKVGYNTPHAATVWRVHLANNNSSQFSQQTICVVMTLDNVYPFSCRGSWPLSPFSTLAMFTLFPSPLFVSLGQEMNYESQPPAGLVGGNVIGHAIWVGRNQSTHMLSFCSETELSCLFQTEMLSI